ncbi:beta-1,3-galactosyltransferase 5-like [Bufo bufo]|uniref:beta-1,3-galactosyltransferase 5-like n=1 Tax=Bufo bufo TaxID=8384 RepID=UPI001ABED4CB|nr:beta-1,3-galactosyltransferase 5-like [Bufo bufo]
MAVRKAWLLKVLLCVATFIVIILLWGRRLETLNTGQWLSFSPLVSSRTGVDFSLLSEDLLEPSCLSGLGLLILVTSHAQHRALRTAIRKTWALQYEDSAYPWQVVFLVGRPLDVELDWHVHSEHETNGDILMGNYVDTYRNLTLKVMHGIKWAVERCQPLHILRTGDDCYVNTLKLPSFLSKHSPSNRLYVGSVYPEDKRLVIRDPSSKWYVSHQDYEHEVYPPYASGIGYILSLDAAKVILQTARRVKPLPVEDAYVGILADRAHIPPLSSARFAKHNAKWSTCNYRYLLVIHGLSPEDQMLAQKNVLRTRTACTHSTEVTHWK